MAKILMIEDDLGTAQTVQDWLTNEHHVVDLAHNGEDGLYLATNYAYELLIIDWDLPKLSGLNLLKQFRLAGGMSPCLMLTGKAEIPEKSTAFESGCDDYLTKPFHFEELSCRVRALLRRTPVLQASVITVGNLCLDTSSTKVTKSGVEIKLLPKEIALLEFLMRHPNQYFTSDALLQRVWSSDSEATELAVRSAIMRLRKKVGDSDDASLIESSRGLGYRIKQ